MTASLWLQNEEADDQRAVDGSRCGDVLDGDDDRAGARCDIGDSWCACGGRSLANGDENRITSGDLGIGQRQDMGCRGSGGERASRDLALRLVQGRGASAAGASRRGRLGAIVRDEAARRLIDAELAAVEG